MDWAYRAVLTGTVVAAVLMAARLYGRQLAGLVAGLPVITAPSLLWIAAEHGSEYAARCAVGAVAAAGAAAVFAVAYERLARRRGVLVSLGGGLAAGALAAAALAPLSSGAHGLAVAAAAAVALCTLALRTLPIAPAGAAPARRLRGEVAFCAVTAGLLTGAITVASVWLGSFWSGVMAGLPVISATVMAHQHLTASHGDRQRFLRGYVAGLIGKAGFAGAFSAGVALTGIVPAAAAALLAGLALSMLVTEFVARADAAALAADLARAASTTSLS